MSTPAHVPTAGWSVLFAGGHALRSVALCAGVALHAINLYLVATMLPTVVQDIGGAAFFAWNTSLFVAMSIVGTGLAATLLQRLGPRAAYLASLGVFALGAVMCAAAPTMPALLAGRCVQGVGGGLLVALPYALISRLYPPSVWPRVMAMISGMWGVATLVGPALGGVFAQFVFWRAAFWMLIPLSALCAAAAWAALPALRHRQEGAKPAWTQLVLLGLAVLMLSGAGIAQSVSWRVAGVGCGIVLLAALLYAEFRAQHRLLPIATFERSSGLARLYMVMAALAVTVTGSEVFMPLFLQQLHGQAPLSAGYLAAIMSAAWTAGAVISANRRMTAAASRAAPAICCVAMVALALLVSQPSDGGWPRILLLSLPLVCIGAAVGWVYPHLAAQVVTCTAQGESERASASIMTTQLLATAVAAAVGGVVANSAGLVDPGGTAGASTAARWLFLGYALPPAWVCLMGWKRRR